MRRIYLVLFILISFMLTSCQVNNPHEIVFKRFNESPHTLKQGIDLEDESDYDEQLTLYKEIYLQKDILIKDIFTITISADEYGYLYELEDDASTEKLFHEKSDDAYVSGSIWFVYLYEHMVIEIKHHTDSDFPDIFDDLNFEANYHYQFFYAKEIDYPSIFGEFLEHGILLERDSTNDEFRKTIYREQYDIGFISFYRSYNNPSVHDFRAYIFESDIDASKAIKHLSLGAFFINAVRYQNAVFTIQMDLFGSIDNVLNSPVFTILHTKEIESDIYYEFFYNEWKDRQANID